MNPSYKTNRLSVSEVFSAPQESETLAAITTLLSPKVVESLPSNFQNINSLSDAEDWYRNMLSESRLFMVNFANTDTIIGFVFVFVENDTDAHIGYLLGEPYWGQGYATELLEGLITFMKLENQIKRLVAGVARNNIVSSKLLHKLGFNISASEHDDTAFYELILFQS